MSAVSNKFKTTSIEEFLEKEYVNFEKIFKEKERFLADMSGVVIKCGSCGVIHWKGTEKRCDCAYQEQISMRKSTL